MDQALSSRPLTAESRVRARFRGICGGQFGTVTGFFYVFHVSIIPPLLSDLISSGI
jgi:hypothetical protein